MEVITGGFGWVVANWESILIAINALLGAGIAIALLIPGEQPEKTFQKIAEFLKKFSKK